MFGLPRDPDGMALQQQIAEMEADLRQRQKLLDLHKRRLAALQKQQEAERELGIVDREIEAIVRGEAPEGERVGT